MKTKLLTPLVIAAAAVAASPAGASAVVGHWSSPVQVVRPAADPQSASARAFVAGDGRSLAVSTDGVKPLLATGDVRGVFGAPVALGPESGKSQGLDAALGADGTLAVGWAAGGAAQVSVLRPGASAPVTMSVPGGASGVAGVAVAVGADGAVIVAFRVKEGSSSYRIVSATAAAGASAFGDAAVIDSGSSGVDSPSVAVGPGGAVAVVYRKLAPRYRVEAAVRPAGAAAFEPPQALSSSGAPDIGARVVVDGDGTIVAAWGNGETGPTFALRAPGASAFGAPVSVAAGDTSQSIDLAPTPSGGAALAWAGGGNVRAAVAPAGGAFGAMTEMDKYSGQVLPQPSVAVAPDGTLTVAVNHPDDGGVVVGDAGGGAPTLVGYGQPEALTPVSVAASADRTLVVWRDAAGGISAATRSVAAPAGGGPGEKPAGPDKVAPKVTYAGKSKKIRVGKKLPKTVSVRLRCSEACVIGASGSLRTQPKGAKRRSIAPVQPYTGKKAVAGTQTIKIKLGSLALKDLKKAAKTGRGGQLYLDIRGTDANHNEGRLRLQLSLVRSR